VGGGASSTFSEEKRPSEAHLEHGFDESSVGRVRIEVEHQMSVRERPEEGGGSHRGGGGGGGGGSRREWVSVKFLLLRGGESVHVSWSYELDEIKHLSKRALTSEKKGERRKENEMELRESQ